MDIQPFLNTLSMKSMLTGHLFRLLSDFPFIQANHTLVATFLNFYGLQSIDRRLRSRRLAFFAVKERIKAYGRATTAATFYYYHVLCEGVYEEDPVTWAALILCFLKWACGVEGWDEG
ncbi:hypothetical protein OROMI_022822 [Orobanche minor]